MKNTTTGEQSLNCIQSIFTGMTDQRDPKGVRYPFEPLLILLSLAKICNQDSPSEIADWVTHRGDWLKKKLKLGWKRMPSLSTWQRLIGANIDAGEFDERVGLFFQTLSTAERKLLNLDGKVVCGTRAKETDEQLYLLALHESEDNLVVEQTEVEAGENEISSAKRLLAEAELENKIVSGDAIFAQTQLSRTVIERGGDYLWKLRGNQHSMHELVKAHFASGGDRYMQTAYSLEKGHGRIDERECRTSFRLAGQIEFPYLEQVFQIRRETLEVKTGKRTGQTIYGITSLPVDEYPAERILELTRKHWAIENGLHRRRDVTFKEDQLRQTSKTGGRVLAVLNNLTIGILRKLGWENIAKARRYFEAVIEEAIRLIRLPLDRLL